MSIIVQHAFKQYLICMLELFHNCLGINITETQAYKELVKGTGLTGAELRLVDTATEDEKSDDTGLGLRWSVKSRLLD